MKILAYHVRDDEIPYIKEWTKNHPDVEVKYVPDILTAKTAELAKGFGAVLGFQAVPFSREVLEALANVGVKNLSLRCIGVDNVDFDAVKSLNFQITNVPVYSPSTIAELTISMILQLLRRSLEFDRRVQARDFTLYPLISKDLRSQTVGVVGTGHIGRIVIRLLQAFGAKVVAYDVFHHPEIEQEKLYAKDLNDLVQQSNVITIHIPGSPQNKHMFNKEIIHQAPKGVYLVNTARGNLIDTDALIEALDEGWIAGAALDVYEREAGIFGESFKGKEFPDKKLDNLIKRENVIVTPHIAFYSESAVQEIINTSLNSSLSLLKGETPETIVTHHQ
jgi:D-lactate dehydrogenase